MRAKELIRLLRRQPFEPMRLHLTSGEHVDIAHPEMAIVTHSLVAVGVDEEDGVADYVTHYNLLHIVKVEPLRNGARPSRRSTRK